MVVCNKSSESGCASGNVRWANMPVTGGRRGEEMRRPSDEARAAVIASLSRSKFVSGRNHDEPERAGRERGAE